jgi:cell division protein FtsW (lipid II flippase)
LLISSVKKQNNQAVAARLLRAVKGVERLAITYVRVKRIARCYLIYSVSFYILYYCVVKIKSLRGAQSWWGAAHACKTRYNKQKLFFSAPRTKLV